MRGGVPVFIRPTERPCAAKMADKPFEGNSPSLPPSAISVPTNSRPSRKVPAVRITALAPNSAPMPRRTPEICDSRKVISTTESCQMSKPQVFSRTYRQFSEKLRLSHWARGLHIAGPFDRLSILNWMVEASVTIPEQPPKASISRTSCPLAIPPIAGLHDICAILFMSCVTSRTREPSRAAATAASQPAWPAPTTMMSYVAIMADYSPARMASNNFKARFSAARIRRRFHSVTSS